MVSILHVKITFSICTGYDVIIVCPYVRIYVYNSNCKCAHAHKSGRPDSGAPRVTKERIKKREYRDIIKRKKTRLGWCGTQCMHGA